MKRRCVMNEWMWSLATPGIRHKTPVRIKVDNVRPKDREFVSALAKLASVWLNATARRSA